MKPSKLENHHQQIIGDLIRDKPCITLDEICMIMKEKQGLPRVTTCKILTKLEFIGLVESNSEYEYKYIGEVA